MSISTALEARRDALREREAGFTLIELLVVVIIIGILAAIAIPIYLGIQNNAKESATKSDLTNDKTAITGWAVDNNGNVPAAADVTAANLSKYGWSISNNTKSTIDYATTGTGTDTKWCLSLESQTGTKFRISTSTSVAAGACTGTGALATSAY